MYYGYSPKLPLTTTNTHYDLLYNFQENIKQNFKNLVLTHPGERIMIPDFGVGVRQYLFEIDSDVVFQEVRERIHDQVRTYLPGLTIVDILRASDMNNVDMQEKLGIVIFYMIQGIGMSDQLTILL